MKKDDFDQKAANAVVKKIDSAIEKAPQEMREGVGASIFVHFEEIKEAITSKNWFALFVAIRNAMSHVVGDEGGLRSSKEMEPPEGMKAVPWAVLLPLVLQLVEWLKNRNK